MLSTNGSRWRSMPRHTIATALATCLLTACSSTDAVETEAGAETQSEALCSDRNPCTIDTRARRECVHTPVANGTPCPAGVCAAGTCVPNPANAPRATIDGGTTAGQPDAGSPGSGPPSGSPDGGPTQPTGTTPSIANVTGLVQTGQTLTIAGAGMVSEDRSNWDAMFANSSTSGFEGASLPADGYSTSGCPTYTTQVRLMGAKSINMHDSGQYIHQDNGSGNGSCNWQWPIAASKPGTTWTDVYLRTYSRWNNTSWPTIAAKYWWIGGGSSYAFFNLITNPDGRAPTQFGVYTSGVGSWISGAIPGGAIQNNRWYLFEAHFRMAGSGNYVVEGWIDNERIFSGTSPDGPSPNAGNWGWESNTNYFNTPAGWVSDQWQDGFAVSKTRVGPAALVEVSNSANYATATKVYQEPLFLSDGSIQVKLNLAGLGSGPYFLWVTNNRGARSAARAL